MENNTETVKKLTSTIKKGDFIQVNGNWTDVDSDAYKVRGIWSVDIYCKTAIYGWESRDKEILILNK